MDYNSLSPADMEIKVLGTGCSKCNKLEKLTQKAIGELGIKANITKVEDIQEIMHFGIMQTPGLVINDKVIFSGSLPKLNALKDLITKNL